VQTLSLLDVLIENLQIKLHNVHIRYEDTQSIPQHPFALGITLDHFTMIATDVNWAPRFVTFSVADSPAEICFSALVRVIYTFIFRYVQDHQSVAHKLLELNGLSVYWEHDASLLLTRDLNPDQLRKNLSKGSHFSLRIEGSIASIFLNTLRIPRLAHVNRQTVKLLNDSDEK
jgi:hypothetical protein